MLEGMLIMMMTRKAFESMLLKDIRGNYNNFRLVGR